MNTTIKFPGLKDVLMTKMEQLGAISPCMWSWRYNLHSYLHCQGMTQRVHDYRMQKIKHLKWFERMMTLFCKKRRYTCEACGKKFAEKNPFVNRYQQFSKEWNQAVHVRSIKDKTFKEVAGHYGASASTIVRRFDTALQEVTETAQLPHVIAIDEYKGVHF